MFLSRIIFFLSAWGTFMYKTPVSGLLTKKVYPCSHTGSQERGIVGVLSFFPSILASK